MKAEKFVFILSNIHFEATYSYIEKRDFQISLLRVYSINSMDSQSFHICRMQCNWIQSLKRHSILISESGEMQRIDFLQKQQAITIVCKECHLPRLRISALFYP